MSVQPRAAAAAEEEEGEREEEERESAREKKMSRRTDGREEKTKPRSRTLLLLREYPSFNTRLHGSCRQCVGGVKREIESEKV